MFYGFFRKLNKQFSASTEKNRFSLFDARRAVICFVNFRLPSFCAILFATNCRKYNSSWVRLGEHRKWLMEIWWRTSSSSSSKWFGLRGLESWRLRLMMSEEIHCDWIVKIVVAWFSAVNYFKKLSVVREGKFMSSGSTAQPHASLIRTVNSRRFRNYIFTS